MSPAAEIPTSSNEAIPTVLRGHAAWASLAVAPAGTVFAREEGRLAVEEFQDVIRSSGLERPVDDLPRLAAMLANANLVITARDITGRDTTGRDTTGRLVGVARSLTDFTFCCYLSDLCVQDDWQGRGVGRALIAETKRVIGPGAMLLLLSAAKPLTYYPRIGMEAVGNGFIIRRD